MPKPSWRIQSLNMLCKVLLRELQLFVHGLGVIYYRNTFRLINLDYTNTNSRMINKIITCARHEKLTQSCYTNLHLSAPFFREFCWMFTKVGGKRKFLRVSCLGFYIFNERLFGWIIILEWYLLSLHEKCKCAITI